MAAIWMGKVHCKCYIKPVKRRQGKEELGKGSEGLERFNREAGGEYLRSGLHSERNQRAPVHMSQLFWSLK